MRVLMSRWLTLQHENALSRVVPAKAGTQGTLDSRLRGNDALAAGGIFKAVNKVFVFLVFIMFCGSIHAYAADKKHKYTGTFSSLEYNKEGGDLLGVEIKIVPTRKGYQGVLQIAEGGPGQLMLVDVLFEKDTVRFEIPSSYPEYGGGIFEGKIDSKGIKGTFRFKGAPGEQENLIRGRSYWDK